MFSKSDKIRLAFSSVPALLVLMPLIFVNILQFPLIEARNNTGYTALSRFSQSDLLTIGTKNSPGLRAELTAWTVLKEISKNTTLYVSENSTNITDNDVASFYSFAEGNTLRYIDIDERIILESIEPENFIVVDGRVGNKQNPSFAFALDGYTDRELTSKFGLIPDVLTVAPFPQEKNLDLVLLRWDKKESLSLDKKSTKKVTYNLFIDTDLLPNEVKERFKE